MNNDLISREALKRAIKTECNPYGKPTIDFESGKKVLKIIDNAPTVEQPTGEWIPVTTRPCTDEEFEQMKKLFGEDIERDEFPFFDCPMPNDGQEILITTAWGVEKDTCDYDSDYGYALEGRGDWEDVTAWMPSPKPYVKGGETNG